MATAEVFQPAAFGAGVTAPVIAGPVLSSPYDAVTEVDGPLQPVPSPVGEAAAVTVCTPSPLPVVN